MAINFIQTPWKGSVPERTALGMPEAWDRALSSRGGKVGLQGSELDPNEHHKVGLEPH